MTIQPVESEARASLPGEHEMMLREIRSWGLWSLGLGALHLVASGFLNAPWGIVLLLVGLGSFYFKSAAMFVVYALTLAWAALSNLAALEARWIALAVFQLFLAYRVFGQYRRFRAAEGEARAFTPDASQDRAAEGEARALAPDASRDRAARAFPWLGSLLSCSSLLGFAMLVASMILVLALAGDASGSYPLWMDFAMLLLFNLGALGFAVALAALLSKYRPRALAIVGLVAGGIMLAIQVLLLIP